jgi:hypothetical protein
MAEGLDMSENLLTENQGDEGPERGGRGVTKEMESRGQRNRGNTQRGKGLKERNTGTFLLFLGNLGIGERKRKQSDRSR